MKVIDKLSRIEFKLIGMRFIHSWKESATEEDRNRVSKQNLLAIVFSSIVRCLYFSLPTSSRVLLLFVCRESMLFGISVMN